MLDTLFTAVLDMTVKGSLVILVVLLARLLLRRAPKAVSYGLWIVVLLRLLCPVSIQLPVSVLPDVAPVTPNYALDDTELSFAEVGAAAIDSVGDMVSGGSGVQQIPVKPQTSVQQPEVQQYISASAKEIWILFCAYLWVAGFAVMAVYSMAGTFRMKRNLREAVLIEKGIYQTDRYDTPFVIGLLRPRIYLPLGLEDNEKLLILTHEKQHIRRLDPVWKALGFLTLSIHWFNPLVWVAFICACRDMEMSCDEAVLKSMGGEVRGAYAASLLKITTGRRIVAGAPLTFGEGDPKGRIRNLAKWKKPILWTSIVAVAACTVLAVCLLTDPVSRKTAGNESVPTEPMGTEQGSAFDVSKVPFDGSLPLEKLPHDYNREDAIRDGVAVMEYESGYANTDVWDDFVKAVEQGKPARVRAMNCRMGLRMYMYDILFDGRYFMLRQPIFDTEGGLFEVKEAEFSYLVSFAGELEDNGTVYESYIRYGLCMEDPGSQEPAWEQWHIAGTEPIIVFQYTAEYTIHPQIPETLVSAKLMLEDLTMGTVTDPQKLESLRNMLAHAELDPDIKNYFAMEELYLDLMFSDGTQLQLTMFPELDRILLDGKAYDYGPWDKIKIDEGQEYPVDYNALLDLVRHFGLEDWPEEFRRWCLDNGKEPPGHSLKVLVGEEPHDH